MKKLIILLGLVGLLCACSESNNTQTTTASGTGGRAEQSQNGG